MEHENELIQTAPWGEKELSALRLSATKGMSAKRMIHTIEVEKMITRLCALFCPEETNMLRAAALLHDITKEYKLPEQLDICDRLGVARTRGDELAPKCFHAVTAAALIPERFPEFALPTVVDAVRWHTTGHAGMTLTEKLIYLADYIDESRTFPDCVTLRTMFWGQSPEDMTMPERLTLLRTVLITSYDMTMTGLIADGTPISPDTILARNELLYEQAAADKCN